MQLFIGVVQLETRWYGAGGSNIGTVVWNCYSSGWGLMCQVSQHRGCIGTFHDTVGVTVVNGENSLQMLVQTFLELLTMLWKLMSWEQWYKHCWVRFSGMWNVEIGLMVYKLCYWCGNCGILSSVQSHYSDSDVDIIQLMIVVPTT